MEHGLFCDPRRLSEDAVFEHERQGDDPRAPATGPCTEKMEKESSISLTPLASFYRHQQACLSQFVSTTTVDDEVLMSPPFLAGQQEAFSDFVCGILRVNPLSDAKNPDCSRQSLLAVLFEKVGSNQRPCTSSLSITG
jgi:hypothetical protein